MAQYKVPQDVEAEDKLLGPFTFRQFVYLLIAGGLIAMAVGLFQLFPLLALIPVLPALLFLVLALPLKKDQPMETYLAAIVSYYLKPRKRMWTTGQRESTILITAPKIVEDVRTRNLSQEEATHRLSFLADIVDSEGYAIKGMSGTSMREDLVAEANATTDMFDEYSASAGRINQAINQEQQERHAEVIRGMREAIERTESYTTLGGAELPPEPSVSSRDLNVSAKTVLVTSSVVGATPVDANKAPSNIPTKTESVVVLPDVNMNKRSATPQHDAVKKAAAPEPKPNASVMETNFAENPSTKLPKASIIELANNPDFSVATIAKEANRINRKEEGEVFISLH